MELQLIGTMITIVHNNMEYKYYLDEIEKFEYNSEQNKIKFILRNKNEHIYFFNEDITSMVREFGKIWSEWIWKRPDKEFDKLSENNISDEEKEKRRIAKMDEVEYWDEFIRPFEDKENEEDEEE